jgi:2-keto-4-pentenoate hydratase
MTRLTDAEICAAADLLVGAREGRVTLAGLPRELTPEHTADVQRIIDAVSARVDRPVMGWKTYTVYKPMQPPFHAPIYDLLLSGSEIPAGISPGRLIEPEVMFRADRDLPARDRPYGIGEIAGAVTAVVGFEVIGSRYRSDGELGEGSLYGSYADHIANGCIVVGDPIPGWQEVVFEDVRLRVTEDERELAAVVGCHPFDNPFLPVVVAINRLRRTSGVQAGQVIVTSSSTSFFPVQTGAVIRAVYERLGEVTAAFGHS